MSADPITNTTVDNLLLEDDVWDLGDDPFANDLRQPERDDKTTLSPRKRKALNEKEEDSLGLENEIKIVKKRKPIAKLDEARLLCDLGIPKLRSLIRSGEVARKLRFKGKGHEFSDAAKLLNHYQLWLDSLYPRAKFADALSMVEKVGHSKRMHIMRREWIDQGKPGYQDRGVSMVEMEDDNSASANLFAGAPKESTGDQIYHTSRRSDDGVPSDHGLEDNDQMFFSNPKDVSEQIADPDLDPDDDELDALLAMHTESSSKDIAPLAQHILDDSEGEDDLDALLAEQDAGMGSSKTTDTSNTIVSGRAALDSTPRQTESNKVDVLTRNRDNDDDDDDDDDDNGLDALMAQQSAHPDPELPQQQHELVNSSAIHEQPNFTDETVPELDNMVSSSPIPNLHTDDLEQLLEEHDETMGHATKGGIINNPLCAPVPDERG